MMKFIKNNKFNILIVLFWLFICITTLLCHEPWRDELQVWCIVRDCNLFDIYKLASVEGHPILWYLIILPFAKLGFPVVSMQIVSLLFVFAAVILLVFKSSFNTWFKILIIFSSGLLYFLPIVSRNYALIPLFLFLSAYFYPKRLEKPILFSIILVLLSNTHTLIWGFCSMLSLFFVLETISKALKDKSIKLFIPSIILFFNYLFLYLSFSKSLSENVSVLHYSSSSVNIPLLTAMNDFASFYYIFAFETVIFYSLFAMILVSLLKINKKFFVIMGFTFVYTFYIYYKVWFNGILYQKSFILLLTLVFFAWVVNNYKKKIENYLYIKLFNIAFIVLFFFNLAASYFIIENEKLFYFSTAKQVSNYIKENLNDEKEFIIVGYPFTFTSISAYLPDKKFLLFQTKCYMSYYNFDNKTQDKMKKNPCLSKLPDTKYYIVQNDFKLEGNVETIFKTDDYVLSGKTYTETFTIYKKTGKGVFIKPQKKETASGF